MHVSDQELDAYTRRKQADTRDDEDTADRWGETADQHARQNQ